jgi:hypothetical protein
VTRTFLGVAEMVMGWSGPGSLMIFNPFAQPLVIAEQACFAAAGSGI